MSNEKNEIDVDAVINKLLEVRGTRPGRQVNLTEGEIRGLVVKSREIFLSQPCLLELEAPIKICGTFTRVAQKQCNATLIQIFGVLNFSFKILKICLKNRHVKQVIFTVNTMICYAYSNMVVSHQMQTISSWEIM